MSGSLTAFGYPLLSLLFWVQKLYLKRVWFFWILAVLRVGVFFVKCLFASVKSYFISSIMASLTSSSRRSSSSYRSSSRYSTSSSFRSEGSLGGSSDSLDPLFEPFLDSADHTTLFGEEGPGGPSCLSPFSRHSRSSYGHTGKETD